MKDDHVVCDFAGPRPTVVLAPEEQLVMRCLHCGHRWVFPVPASITMVALVSKQYVREHRRCKASPVSPPANPEG